MLEIGWRTDRVLDADESVRWRPALRVTEAGIWAGQADDGRWIVGRPGRRVMRTGSPGGVIALLPLLQRPMAEVAAELGAGSLTGHGLGFERVVDAAFDERASAHWAGSAIAWIEAGFPARWYGDGLQRVLSDKRIDQRARQAAGRILAREFPLARRLSAQPD